ncbi:MAG: hypothetical protein ACRCZY_03145 [Phocaeicola sp.]
MNEKINLVELLEGCEGETIYCKPIGNVRISSLSYSEDYPILIKASSTLYCGFSEFGEAFIDSGECLLFPSKDQLDWNKWKAEREAKVEAKMEYQFKPFEKVLVRDSDMDLWECSFYSHKAEHLLYVHMCLGSSWNYCIPYEGSEHLLGTTDNV